MELMDMLQDVPLQHFLRVIEYYDKALKLYAESVEEEPDLSEIEMSAEIQLSDQVLQLILGVNYKEEMDKVIIVPDNPYISTAT